jgi:DDE superfamily endonuclease
VSHKGPRVEQLIKAAGAELRYLPPYSPDMNPIETAMTGAGGRLASLRAGPERRQQVGAERRLLAGAGRLL